MGEVQEELEKDFWEVGVDNQEVDGNIWEAEGDAWLVGAGFVNGGLVSEVILLGDGWDHSWHGEKSSREWKCVEISRK